MSSFPMNFRLSTEERLRAAIIGIPAWIRRKREIEDRLAAAAALLQDAPEEKRRKLATDALTPINALIEKHNLYYPIEANLPIDPRTGQMLDRGTLEPWKPMPRVTVAALLARA